MEDIKKEVCCEPTYEELKPKENAETISSGIVASLPMRN